MPRLGTNYYNSQTNKKTKITVTKKLKIKGIAYNGYALEGVGSIKLKIYKKMIKKEREALY